MARAVKNNYFLVNAPAGSGKTTQIKEMLSDITRRQPKDNILCITYTNRAADELAIGVTSEKICIGTIHSFLHAYMKKYFSNSKILNLFFDVYEHKIQERILNKEAREHITESNLRYIERFGDLSFDIIRGNVKLIYYNESPFNSLYYGGLSHDDLVIFSKKIMDVHPIVNKRISSKYQYIFIDEYQDTAAEVLNIFYDSCSGGNSELYLFGDKMQQIYKNYDGSFEGKISEFDTSKSLEINYRSSPRIVELLNNIYNTPAMKQQSFNIEEGEASLPRLIISDDIQSWLADAKKDGSALTLYLLNAKRFEAIGAVGLLRAYSQMKKYSHVMGYSYVDVLISEYSENPDPLMKLLYLVMSIWSDFKLKKHGLIIQKIKKNKHIFNESASQITSHNSKGIFLRKVLNLVDAIDNEGNSIGELLVALGESLVKADYINGILGDADYNMVLEVKVNELKLLVNYLENPMISTQHGVKGESHNSIIFVAEDSSRIPVVHMYRFFEMWSQIDISLPSFHGFYYEYSSLLTAMELRLGFKVSDLNAASYKDYSLLLINYAGEFLSRFQDNPFFGFLCMHAYEKFISSPNVSNAKNCFKVNAVFGSLSAYKLFYVGCSRARKNLTILLDRAKVQGDILFQIEKFRNLGFEISFDVSQNC